MLRLRLFLDDVREFGALAGMLLFGSMWCVSHHALDSPWLPLAALTLSIACSIAMPTVPAHTGVPGEVARMSESEFDEFADAVAREGGRLGQQPPPIVGDATSPLEDEHPTRPVPTPADSRPAGGRALRGHPPRTRPGCTPPPAGVLDCDRGPRGPPRASGDGRRESMLKYVIRAPSVS